MIHDLGDLLFHLYNRHDERDLSTGGDIDQQSHLKGDMIIWVLMKGVVLRPLINIRLKMRCSVAQPSRPLRGSSKF